MGTITSGKQQNFNIPVGEGALLKYLQTHGRSPPITMKITSIDTKKSMFFDAFLDYTFDSSILIPADQFSFNLLIPGDSSIVGPDAKEGDIIELYGNGKLMSTGLIDVVDPEMDADYGEKIAITGRDLLGQWEDQDSVSINSEMIVADKFTVNQAVAKLSENSRIAGKNVILRDCPRTPQTFCSQPGEKKIATLQRFTESLNVLFWMSPEGRIIVGKPNFAQAAKQRLFISKSERNSNVMSMKASFAAGRIPNIVVPIINGQQNVQSRLPKEQIIYNPASGPTRLRLGGHIVTKMVVVSAPDGTNAEELQSVTFANAAVNDGGKPGFGNLLRAHARREIARSNKDELVVQVQALGHYNDLGEPYMTDTVYKIFFEGSKVWVDEDMYLFHVQYKGGEGIDQVTTLWFCKKHTLVSDTRVK